jgi:hypothetical protein
MAEKKKQYIKVVIGPGVAAYSWLQKPDTGHKYSDNKYKVTVVTDGDYDTSDLEAKAKEAAKLHWGKVPEDLKLFIVNGDDVADNAKNKDKDKEEFRGKLLFTAKSKFQPGFVDAKRNELPEGVEVKAGDLIKVSALLYPYEQEDEMIEKVGNKKVKTKVTTYGISLQLRNVQLLEKRNNGGSAADDFDNEDGYEGAAADDNDSSKGNGGKPNVDDF